MNDLDRMKELIHTLNEAGKAYYQQNKEVMSNLEYDKMYDELLEKYLERYCEKEELLNTHII